MVPKIDYYSYFLFLSGICRFMLFIMIFFRNDYLIHKIHFNGEKDAQGLYKRILLYWVIFGSYITVLTSYNTHLKPMMQITFVLNIIGCCYHGSEHFIFKKNLKSEFITIFVFLVPTLIWTGIRLFSMD
ncbi:hypothetical protein ACTFIU_002045 [Dictyostelium citrinum]